MFVAGRCALPECGTPFVAPWGTNNWPVLYCTPECRRRSQKRTARRRRKGCARKIRHESWALATQALRRLRERDQLKPYWCKFCEGWHLGHPIPESQ